MAGDKQTSGSYQLEVGSILRQGETLYIVERGPSPEGDVVVGELGNREIKRREMFDLGDECPLPICDGEIVEADSSRRRHCSEGCLEWIRNVPADGDPCPEYNCEDGEAIINIQGDSYRKKCTECSVLGGGSVRWREAWWPYAKQETLDHLSSSSDDRNGCEADTDSAQDDGTPITDGGRNQWWCKQCGHATDRTPWDVEDCPECGAFSWVNRRYMVEAEPTPVTDGGVVRVTREFDDNCDAEVAEAMLEELGDDSFTYIKTQDIADRTAYSLREVAHRLRRVADQLDLEIERWAHGHSSTTWHLTRGDEG